MLRAVFGGARPSGAGALQWRRFRTAFGEKSNSLCEALAMTPRKLATALTDLKKRQALTTSHNNGFEKISGGRLIGFGDPISFVLMSI